MMKIVLVDKEKHEFEVSYPTSGFIHREIVSERVARMLEHAIEAGRKEKANEIKQALGII